MAFYSDFRIFPFFYKMLFSIRVRRGYPSPSVFFCIPPLLNFFSGVELKLCLLSENVNILLKWRLFVEIQDIFMLALFYLENLMKDFQYKMLFSIRVRGGTPTLSVFLYTSPFQFIFWSCTKIVSSVRSENIKIWKY